MKPQVAFLGLGTMGLAMASNLCEAGFRLRVWNRSAERAHPLTEKGAVIANTPAAAVKEADFILYSLANDSAIENVVFGADGILQGAGAEGQMAINLSTTHPDINHREARAYAECGVAYLDAPVFGSLPEAEAADLCIVAGGAQADYQRALPMFNALASSVYHMGGTGKGASTGLIGSLMVCMQLQALGEGLALAYKVGLDTATVVEILGLPDFRSPLFTTMGAQIIDRQFEPVFSLDHLYKDANQILRLADQLGVSVPGCTAVHEVIKSAVAHGWGHENASAMVKALELQANIAIARQPKA